MIPMLRGFSLRLSRPLSTAVARSTVPHVHEVPKQPATATRAARAVLLPTVQICLPQLLHIGGGCSNQSISGVLRTLGCSRPLIVTDDFIANSSSILPPISAALEESGFGKPRVFSGCVPDPTTESVRAGLDAWEAVPEDERADCLVAVGGGSSIDSAKAIAMLAVHGGKMSDYKFPAEAPAGLPVIAVPTTAGTGSEATRVTIVTDTTSSEKMLCMGAGLMPRAALVDFELTLSAPYRLTADSGLDSLCHAMEAYVSRKANVFSDSHALVAMRAIPSALRGACADLSNVHAREALMSSATHAGIAFSNASVTLIHGMSRPIGAHFHVPHGLSNAMLLPLVTEFSIGGATERYAECARAMGFARADAYDDDACRELVAGLRSLCSELQVPSPAAYGITRDAWSAVLDTMAEQALASGSPNNNPIVPSASEIRELYERVYEGEA